MSFSTHFETMTAADVEFAADSEFDPETLSVLEIASSVPESAPVVVEEKAFEISRPIWMDPSISKLIDVVAHHSDKYDMKLGGKNGYHMMAMNIFNEKKKKGYYRFGLYTRHQSLFQLSASHHVRESGFTGNSFYHFQGTEKCYLFVDCEYGKDSDGNDCVEGQAPFDIRGPHFRGLLEEVIDIIVEAAAAQNMRFEYSVHFSENQQRKSSAHVHFVGPVWNGREDQGRWLRKHCAQLFDPDCAPYLIFDKTIHNSGGNLRALNGWKPKQLDRVLSEVPDPELSSGRAVHLYKQSRDAFFDVFGLPWPKDHHVYTVPLTPVESKAKQLKKRKQDTVEGDSYQQEGSKQARVGSQCVKGFFDPAFECVQKALPHEVLSIGSYKYSYNSTSKQCNIAGREHSSNHVFYNLKRKGDRHFLEQGCFNETCRSKPKHVTEIAVVNSSLDKTSCDPDISFEFDSFEDVHWKRIYQLKELMQESPIELANVLVDLSKRHGAARLVHSGGNENQFWYWCYNTGLWKESGCGTMNQIVSRACGNFLTRYEVANWHHYRDMVSKGHFHPAYIEAYIKFLKDVKDVEACLAAETAKKLVEDIQKGSAPTAEEWEFSRTQPFKDDEPSVACLVYKAKTSISFTKEIVMAMAPGCYVAEFADCLNREKKLLSLKDGVVNLETGCCYERTPGMFITYSVKCVTMKEVQRALLHNEDKGMHDFVLEIMEDDKDRASFLHELFGYMTTGETKDQIFSVFHGQMGANGKGVLVGCVMDALGEDFFGSLSGDCFIKKERGASSGAATPHLKPMITKRIGFYDEAGKSDHFDEDELKRLSGADENPITYRDLYMKGGVQKKVTARMILATNDIPAFTAADDAFMRRLIVIPFNLKFVDDVEYYTEDRPSFYRRKKPDVGARLKANKAGIIAWLVNGAKLYYIRSAETGTLLSNRKPDSVRDKIQETRDSVDSLKEFIEERCAVAPKGVDWVVSKAVLYVAYQNHAQANSYKPLNSPDFGKAMRWKRFTEKKKHCCIGGDGNRCRLDDKDCNHKLRKDVWSGLKLL